ncbi:hypothetical protein JCM18750_33340 [Halostagnicola bangensis]
MWWLLTARRNLEEVCSELDALTLSDVCEADEMDVTAGEKGVEKEEDQKRIRARAGPFD